MTQKLFEKREEEIFSNGRYNIKYFYLVCMKIRPHSTKKWGDYSDNDPRFGIKYRLLIFRTHTVKGNRTTQYLQLSEKF